MIKKTEETGKELKKISNFKKFTDMANVSKIKEPTDDTAIPPLEQERPGIPNLPLKNIKKEKTMSTTYMKPSNKDGDSDDSDDSDAVDFTNENKKVKFYGKIAKLPKGVKAANGYNFLENIKVPKSSIWYIMVERQDDTELQMVKYNNSKGVELAPFITDLKKYYIKKYKKNEKICSLIDKITIDGGAEYSSIKNIPYIEIDGKKMISRITEDLIKLLSK